MKTNYYSVKKHSGIDQKSIHRKGRVDKIKSMVSRSCNFSLHVRNREVNVGE